jgi:transcriptional regulator with XRE-family HTH domain
MARESAGLTQRELALRLGVSQPAVTQAERWISNPTVAFLRLWAEACDCELHWELAVSASEASVAEGSLPYDAKAGGGRKLKR